MVFLATLLRELVLIRFVFGKDMHCISVNCRVFLFFSLILFVLAESLHVVMIFFLLIKSISVTLINF